MFFECREASFQQNIKLTDEIFILFCKNQQLQDVYLLMFNMKKKLGEKKFLMSFTSSHFMNFSPFTRLCGTSTGFKRVIWAGTLGADIFIHQIHTVKLKPWHFPRLKPFIIGALWKVITAREHKIKHLFLPDISLEIYVKPRCLTIK